MADSVDPLTARGVLALKQVNTDPGEVKCLPRFSLDLFNMHLSLRLAKVHE